MSSDMMTQTTSEGQASPEKPKHYRFSALLSGFGKMWRSALPALIIILINAVVQAALVVNDPVADSGWLFYVQAAVSAVVLLFTGAVLSACALESVTRGRVRIARAFGLARSHFLLFSFWVILQTVAIVGAGLLPTFPGSFSWAAWLVWALTVYIPLAAMDGRRMALWANLRAIGARPFRWLVTWLILSVLGLAVWLTSALNTFFITGWLSAAIASVVVGLVAWWWLTAWACLYRSGPEGMPAPAEGAAAAGNAAGADPVDQPPTARLTSPEEADADPNPTEPAASGSGEDSDVAEVAETSGAAGTSAGADESTSSDGSDFPLFPQEGEGDSPGQR